MKKMPQIEAVNGQGEVVDSRAAEDMGTIFDPATQHIELSKEERRRTTALLMAIQAYDHLIIKDAEMYKAISDDSRRDNGPKIQPATIEAMIYAAIKFDKFIAGEDAPAESLLGAKLEEAERAQSKTPAPTEKA